MKNRLIKIKWALLFLGVGSISTAMAYGLSTTVVSALDKISQDTPPLDKKLIPVKGDQTNPPKVAPVTRPEDSGNPNPKDPKTVTPEKGKNTDLETQRKQLEEMIKKMDLNDPRYEETIRKYHKIMDEIDAKNRPQVPQNQFNPGFGGFGGPAFNPGMMPGFGGFPADMDKMIREIQEMNRRQLERFQQMQRNGGIINFMPGDFGRGFPFGQPGNGRLGISIETPSEVLVDQLNLPPRTGMVVRSVRVGSAADKAGLKTNDIIVEMNGKSVADDPITFSRTVQNLDQKAPFSMTIIRKGKREKVDNIKLPEIPVFDQPREIGGIGVGGNNLFNGNNNLNQESISVSVNNDDFAIHSVKNGVRIDIKGHKTDNKNELDNVSIKDGKKSYDVKKIEDVPESYRDRVKELLNSVQ